MVRPTGASADLVPSRASRVPVTEMSGTNPTEVPFLWLHVEANERSRLLLTVFRVMRSMFWAEPRGLMTVGRNGDGLVQKNISEVETRKRRWKEKDSECGDASYPQVLFMAR